MSVASWALVAYGVAALARDAVTERGARSSDRRYARARRRSAGSPDEPVRSRAPARPHPGDDLRPETEPRRPPAPDGEEPRRKSFVRRRGSGLALIVLGIIVLTYAAAVVLWRDPLTDVYARWQQGRLEDSLGATFAEFDEPELPNAGESRASGAYRDPDAYARAESEAIAKASRRMRGRVRLGQPIGRIAIPRLGVNAVFVHGTRWGPDLSRGPGHYKETPLPGIGKTAAIAAHRTTFGAWFRHIDDLRRGDRITVSLPYATFDYKVFTHKIVDDEDWSIIKSRGFDTLVLSACHPLYSAAQRWVVFARVTSVKPRGGEPYAVTAKGEPVAAQAI